MFYFIGYKNVEINEEKTNKLKWKNARKFWNMSIIEKLKMYNPYGPKGPLPSYAMSSKLLLFFESVDKEAVKKYSFVLSKILDFLIIGNI